MPVLTFPYPSAHDSVSTPVVRSTRLSSPKSTHRRWRPVLDAFGSRRVRLRLACREPRRTADAVAHVRATRRHGRRQLSSAAFGGPKNVYIFLEARFSALFTHFPAPPPLYIEGPILFVPHAHSLTTRSALASRLHSQSPAQCPKMSHNVPLFSLPASPRLRVAASFGLFLPISTRLSSPKSAISARGPTPPLLELGVWSLELRSHTKVIHNRPEPAHLRFRYPQSAIRSSQDNLRISSPNSHLTPYPHST